MPEGQQTLSLPLTVALRGEGASFDPASLALMLDADPDRATIEAVVSVPAEAGRPRRDFLVAVTDMAAARRAATVFDGPEALALVEFVGIQAPEWTQQDGFARLVPARGSRAHGSWTKAAGDGLYRCLVRWSGAAFEHSLDRRFSFGARIARAGADWTGVRVDAFMTAAGTSRLQLREYAGTLGVTVSLAVADAPWSYDAWHWLDVEADGASIRARIYPEAAEAPEWQVTGVARRTGAGAFGPGGFPALEESPVIDVRRLEYRPLGD